MAMDKNMLLVVAAMCVLLYIVGIGVGFAVYQANGSSPGPSGPSSGPYKDLPTAPPRVSQPAFQDELNRMFRSKSGCWALNRYLRVTMANGFVEVDSLLMRLVRKQITSKQYAEAAANLLNKLQYYIPQCPANTILEYEMPTGEVRRFDWQTYQQFMKKTFQETVTLITKSAK
jgi:hypothetical protein